MSTIALLEQSSNIKMTIIIIMITVTVKTISFEKKANKQRNKDNVRQILVQYKKCKKRSKDCNYIANKKLHRLHETLSKRVI